MRSIRTQLRLLVASSALVLGLAVAAAVAAQPMCVYGVSKSLCKARLDGNWRTTTPCSPDATGRACNTASGQGRFSGAIVQGDLGCDEVPDLDGATLDAVVESRLRLQTPKPFRGDMVGRFAIHQEGSAIGDGTFDGTLGVGTHHPAHCDCSSASCENCYVAAFNPSSKTWTLHSEGFLEGALSAGKHQGCKIRWSYAGNFTAAGDEKSPQLGKPWDFCGTLDGVLECPCPQPGKAKRPGT